jgi:hypothetical protein
MLVGKTFGRSTTGVDFRISHYAFVPSGNWGEVLVDLGYQQRLIQRRSELRNALVSPASDLFYAVRDPLVNFDCKLLRHGNVSYTACTH